MNEQTKRAAIASYALLASCFSVACEKSDVSPAAGSSTATGGRGAPGGGLASGGGAAAGGAGGGCPIVHGEVVSLTTSDGVALQGDLYTTGKTGGAGAVLLHMIPPGNDRSNYPIAFIDKLVAAGISVINIDRRGAGESAGTAKDAYTGPSGKFDAIAAREVLLKHACAADPGRIAMVGASNGTTSVLDFAVFAATDAATEVPKAMVFLTGGSYTEAQNMISAHRVSLDLIPIQFVFSSQESTWSVPFKTGAPSNWLFDEYDPGAHGTNMFTTRAESIDSVVAFLSARL